MNYPMRISFCSLLVILFLSACKRKRPDIETITETTIDTVISYPVVEVLKDKYSFRIPAVGWTVRLPEKWKKIYKEKNYELDEDEQEKIDDVMSSGIDNYSQKQELITIYKNSFNNFISTIEPYNESVKGSYDEHSIAVHEALKSSYSARNIYAEYEVAARRIDGIMFDIFDTRLYSPDKRKVSLYQSMFNTLINGYDLTITISYNNEADKDSLLSIIQSSKFSIRK